MIRRHLITDILKGILVAIVAVAVLFVIVYSIVVPETSPFYKTTTIIRNIVYALTIGFIITVVVLENRNPVRALAWILALLAMPGVGMFLYIFFGRNYRKRKMYNTKALRDNKLVQKLIADGIQKNDEAQSHLDNPFQIKISNLLYNNSKAFLTVDNHEDIFKDGIEAFDEIFEQIREAKEHIHLEYFSISNDSVGRELRALLIDKAREGVKIRFIIDYVGSLFLGKRFVNKMRVEGIEVAFFSPTQFPFINSRLNYRNHRKIIVIDGEVGFVGGLNIGDSYMSKSRYFGYWRDTHMKLVGEAVRSLQAIFALDWEYTTKENLFNVSNFYPTRITNYNPIQIVSSGPDSDWASIMQVYFTMIAGASKSIKITSPYLVLDDSLLMSIKTAALSGIDVKIIIPGISDHQIVYWGTQSYIQELLEAGVKIYRYKKGFIHAKVLIADHLCASVGTANMDIRSFKHNFEVNALLFGKDAIGKLIDQFGQDLMDCEEIDLEEFNKRGKIRRLRESICRLFSPLL